jgi:tetratricopeptide (TPR) repeat protein
MKVVDLAKPIHCAHARRVICLKASRREAVRTELEKVLGSGLFENAQRLRQFLRFVVETTLAGEAEGIKEYVIGVEVFGDPEFDSSTDARVRVQAGNLRAKLGEYYRTEGQADPVIIELPKGTYVPRFRVRQPETTRPDNNSAPNITVDLPRGTTPSPELISPEEPVSAPQLGALGPEIDAVIPETRALSPDAGRRTIRRNWWVTGGACLAVAALLTFAAVQYWERVRVARSVGPAVASRRAIAVLGFKNRSARPGDDWLSTALSEALTAELAAGGRLRAIRGENVEEAKLEFRVNDPATLSRTIEHRLRRRLDTDSLVTGSYEVFGPSAAEQIQVTITVRDADSGKILAESSERGTKAALFDLASRLGTDVREKLGVQSPPEREQGEARSAFPSSTEAAQLYSQGLARLRSFDAMGARDLLERAIEAEPKYGLAHAALADAWAALGYEGKAKAEAQKALDLAAGLSPEASLFIEGRYRELSKDWNKAAQVYDTLWRFFPDNIEYGLRLAKAQASAGRSQNARETIQKLRQLPPPAGDDPRIDLMEAFSAEMQSDFKLENEAASRAARKAADRGASIMAADALLSEGWALDNLSDLPNAARTDEQARKTFVALGDQAGEARALKNLGDALDDKRDYEGAKHAYQQALDISRQIGFETEVAVSLNNMANVLESQGDLDGAKKMYAESVVTCREIGDGPREALGLGGVGHVLWRQGDLAGAKQMYEQALARYKEAGDRGRAEIILDDIANVLRDRGDVNGAEKAYEESLATSREIGDPDGTVRVLENLGDLLIRKGELAAAKKDFDSALELSKEIGAKRETAYALYGQGEVLEAQGNLQEARRAHLQALTLRDGMGEKSTAAESQLALAQLSLDAGIAKDAELGAKQAAEEFHSENESDMEAGAYAVLGHSYLRQGKLEDASKAVEQARALSGKSEDREVQLLVALEVARVWAAEAKFDEAVHELRAVLNEAQKYKYVSYELEARLSLGEIEMRSDRVSAGRAHLETLRKEALREGFGFIAQEAGRASQRSEW